MGQALEDQIIVALKTVKDPELPINLYDLGLIYDLDVGDDGAVAIRMTLTTPNCPVAEMLPGQVKAAAESVEGVTDVTVDLVWDPPWTGEMMSEEARAALEMMGISWADPKVPGRTTTSLSIGKTGRPPRPG